MFAREGFATFYCPGVQSWRTRGWLFQIVTPWGALGNLCEYVSGAHMSLRGVLCTHFSIRSGLAQVPPLPPTKHPDTLGEYLKDRIGALVREPLCTVLTGFRAVIISPREAVNWIKALSCS